MGGKSNILLKKSEFSMHFEIFQICVEFKLVIFYTNILDQGPENLKISCDWKGFMIKFQ